MRNWLQEYLGINSILTHLLDIRENRLNDRKLLNKLEREIQIRDRMLGRIIAKLDPNYIGDEADPLRKAESDRLSDEVIKRLYAEHEASNRFPRSDS